VTAPADYPVVARNIDPTSDNKIHDDDVAKQFGFSGALVPGVELFAYLTHPLVEAWGEDFLRRGRIDVRFKQPVYDGEQVVAHAESDGAGVDLELRGPDGSVRSAGRAAPAGDRPDGLDRFVEAAQPATLRAATPESLTPGPLGSIREDVSAEVAQRYLDDLSEQLPLYRAQDVVHPGALLRMVNALLVRNVALGPWIHTASKCVLLGVAHFPTVLRAHAIVTETFERNGHDYVRYDALVLSDDVPVLFADHTAIFRIGQGPSR
jgi:hypothetical protein